GADPPLRRRRPAKGAYGDDYDGPGSTSGSRG
ncbi:tRNA (adenine-N1)-methyltransferase, partial [Streptomyces sp. SID4917]